VNLVLNPDTADVVGVPDVYARKTSCFRYTTNFTISSSLANGHVLTAFYPQAAFATGSNYIIRYSDGVSPLDVTNFNVAITQTSTTGTDITANYLFTRVVAFQVKLTYMAAEQTAAGEAVIGLTNTSFAAGTNISAMVRDSDFRALGRAESKFTLNWIPQDDSDFSFRSTNDSFDADKTSNWGMIVLAGTGFPVNTAVYMCDLAIVVENLVKPTSADFIPRSLSLPLDLQKALLHLKQLIVCNPSLVARDFQMALNTGYARGSAPSESQGGPSTSEVSMGEARQRPTPISIPIGPAKLEYKEWMRPFIPLPQQSMPGDLVGQAAYIGRRLFG